MSPFAFILFCILSVASIGNMIMKYRSELQMMQQNSYRNSRYTKWLKSGRNYLNAWAIIDLLMALILLCPHFVCNEWVMLGGIILLAIQIAGAAKKKYKKPLVFTKRVWRLFATMLIVSIVIAIAVSFAYCCMIPATFILLTAISPVIIMISNVIISPIEKLINRKYYNDARRRLSQMPDLKIIGITGSYGKTSTKHYLYRILSEQFDVLMTPGSFNTPMGVIRTVRELMKPYNEVFIVEMGAKQIGDIKEICDLVHPQWGIITAVGEQHLESFKTIQNVQRTKFELVDALPTDGLAVLNDDFEYVANRPVGNVKALRYAVVNTQNADYHATNIEYSETGTRFTIEGESKKIALETKLVGECNISNLMAAVIVALKMGVSDDKIRYSVGQIEQVEHRLNMKHTAGGVTIIDDAFNSNPDGSRMALDVLSRMTKGKRIVVTPGMIELGDKQAFYNERFGEHIANSCDVAIVVGHYNREAIVAGIKKSGTFNEANLHIVDSFANAQTVLGQLLKSGDTVLYENDLPDTFK